MNGYDYSHEDIIEALSVIKEICRATHTCKQCPLGDVDGKCLIADATLNPADWEIKGEETVWRAFGS